MLYGEWLSYVSGPLQSRMLCFQSTASFTEPLGNSMNIDQSLPILTTLSSSYRHIIFLLLSTFSKKVEYILFLVVICYICLLFFSSVILSTWRIRKLSFLSSGKTWTCYTELHLKQGSFCFFKK